MAQNKQSAARNRRLMEFVEPGYQMPHRKALTTTKRAKLMLSDGLVWFIIQTRCF